MAYFEVIVDATTGEQTVRDYTQEETDALLAETAATEVAIRAGMRLTFAQLMIGLVTEGWISQVEGEGWLVGTLPAPVSALIGTLPAEQQFAAKARATRPSEVARLDPLVVALGAAQQKTPEEVDAFFRKYAEV